MRQNSTAESIAPLSASPLASLLASAGATHTSRDELDWYHLPLATRFGQPGSADPELVLPGEYRIDKDHTHVSWTVNHMGFSLLEGMFGASEGSISLASSQIQDGRIEITFDVDSVSVTTPAFADHLRSADFFDVDRYPQVHFVSTSIEPRANSRATITGELTIKNITKRVTVDAAFVGVGQNPMSGKLNFGFAATATINRSDFGLGFIAPVVSDEVKLRINVAFTAD